MIKEVLTDYVRTIGKIWQHDRSVTVGASEIGKCARQVYWTKKLPKGKSSAVVQQDDGWGARTRGTIMEDQFWHPALKHRFGKKLLMSGPDQKSLIAPPLSSTPDGLVTGLPKDFLKEFGIKDMSSNCVLFECKTIDPRVNLREARAENAYQVQVQLGIVRKKTKYRPNYALISYMDASFWDEIKEFPIKFDPAIFKAAEVRATKILTASRPDELQPEGWIAGGKDCEYCPFVKPCGITRRSLPEREAAAEPQFAAEITDMCREAIAIEDAIEADTARLNTKKQEIKNRMREKGVRRVPDVVVWSSIKGRESYDNKAIREAAEAAGVDVEQFSTVGEPTDRLQILLHNGGGSAGTNAGNVRARK